MKVFTALLVILILVAGALALVGQFNLSAMPDPPPLEARLALKARRWLISREVRKHPVQEIPAGPDTIGSGGMTFNGDCAFCHGQDGITPTDVGKGMYPRVPSLASPEVQQWSDAELFWIIKNGNRHTGMGGFGQSLSDQQIWELVHYIRSLASSNPTQK